MTKRLDAIPGKSRNHRLFYLSFPSGCKCDECRAGTTDGRTQGTGSDSRIQYVLAVGNQLDPIGNMELILQAVF